MFSHGEDGAVGFSSSDTKLVHHPKKGGTEGAGEGCTGLDLTNGHLEVIRSGAVEGDERLGCRWH